MRHTLPLVLVATLTLPLPTAMAQQETTLTIGRAASTKALDPGFLLEPATIVDNIFDTLVMRDENMKLVSGLATEWRSIDDTTWEFDLRDGITFHNGEPFDAEAVKFTLERVLDPEANSPNISYIRTIDSVKVVNPLTIRITTKEPDPLLPTRMSRYPAYIVPPDYIAEHGREYFASHPVGTGAYEFVEFVPDQHVILEANEEYWRGDPEIDQVTWRPIPNSTARMTALITGEVDLIEDVPVDLVPMLKQTPDAELVQIENGGLTIYLGLRMDKKPLSNLKVRKALNHAIDRKAITQNLLGSLASPAGTQARPADFGFLDVPVPEYDLELARQLLDEAGYPDGFEITMQASTRYMKNEEVAQAITQQFEDIGLTVNLEILDWSVYTQTVPFEGPIYMLGWGSTQTLDADAALYPIMKSGEPYSGANIPELDRLLDKSREIIEPQKRRQVLHDIQELAAKKVPLITLYQEDSLMGKAPEIQFDGRIDARIPVFEIGIEG